MLNSSISSRRVHVNELMSTYRLTYGCDLRLEDAGASSLTDLINNLIQLSEVIIFMEIFFLFRILYKFLNLDTFYYSTD